MLHTRKAYGEALVELGGEREDIVVVDSDLSSSTQTAMFGRAYPDRFFNVGVAEQNLMGLSAGLALAGNTVFASAFAMFGAGRAWEQIRNTIAYDSLNVKIVLTHAGITVGKDGSSHQILEDLALMRVIPNMKVQVPADHAQTKALVKAAAANPGPHYMRLTREKSPVLFPDWVYTSDEPQLLSEGSDVSILSCGFMLQESIKAVQLLDDEGISARLLNVHTIKPLPQGSILKAAQETGAIVTVEEHSIIGGLGSAVCELLCTERPTPVRRVGIRDRFGKSGDAKALMARYNLEAKDIAEAARDAQKAGQ